MMECIDFSLHLYVTSLLQADQLQGHNLAAFLLDLAGSQGCMVMSRSRVLQVGTFAPTC